MLRDEPFYINSVSLRKTHTLKHLTTILTACLLFGFLTVSANTDGKIEKHKTELEKGGAPKNVGVEKSTETDPNQIKKEVPKLELTNPESPKVVESDSTYNSLNKFNYIFYYIYKYKYDSPTESLRKLFQ